VPGIDRLAQKKLQLTLSVSLHAPTDEIRNTIMPVNKAYSTQELLQACRRYYEKTGRRISFEYAMIHGVNDTPENMEATSLLLAGAEGLKRVELLRYHKTAGAKYPMVGMKYSPDFDEDAVPQIHDMFTERGIKLLVL
jgi:23S rRNA (adenine2503-C2)-methyltransferase